MQYYRAIDIRVGMQMDLFFLMAITLRLLAQPDIWIALAYTNLITDTFAVVSRVTYSELTPSLTYSGYPYVCPRNETFASVQHIP